MTRRLMTGFFMLAGMAGEKDKFTADLPEIRKAIADWPL